MLAILVTFAAGYLLRYSASRLSVCRVVCLIFHESDTHDNMATC